MKTVFSKNAVGFVKDIIPRGRKSFWRRAEGDGAPASGPADAGLSDQLAGSETGVPQ